MSVLTGDDQCRQAAARVLRKLGPMVEKHPYGFARLLGALDFYLSAPKEIALVGDLSDASMQALLKTVYAIYLPNKIVVAGSGKEDDGIPLLQNRSQTNGQPTAYVCENFACKAPVTTPEALAQQLRG